MIRGDWSFRNTARWERQLATAIRRWRTLATRGNKTECDGIAARRHSKARAKSSTPFPDSGHSATQSMNLRRSLLFDGKQNSEESENDCEPDPPHGHLGCDCS